MVKDYAAENEHLSNLLVKLGNQLDGPINSFNTLEGSVTCDGALQRKIKELMLLAVVIARGEKDYLAYHIHKALKAGACRAEVMETIAVAVLAGGSSARLTAALAYEAFEQLGGELPECEGSRSYGP